MMFYSLRMEGARENRISEIGAFMVLITKESKEKGDK